MPIFVKNQLFKSSNEQPILSNQGDQIRGAGPIEKGLNQLGLLWHRNFAVFDFAKHVEIKTDKDLDHISAGEESSETQTGKIIDKIF